MIIFLPISLNMRFGCSKEPSHRVGSFEYPQHMFWLRNKKIIFLLRTLISGGLHVGNNRKAQMSLCIPSHTRAFNTCVHKIFCFVWSQSTAMIMLRLSVNLSSRPRLSGLRFYVPFNGYGHVDCRDGQLPNHFFPKVKFCIC